MYYIPTCAILISMKSRELIVFLAIIVCVLFSSAAHGDSVYSSLRSSAPDIRQFDTFVISFVLNQKCNNPFDQDEIKVSGYFIGPNGKKETVPGFFTGDASLWEIRYTPRETGVFTWLFTVQASGKKITSPQSNFNVLPGKSDGFIRKSKNNYLYTVFDSGKPFFGIGYNLAWSGNNNAADYEAYFANLRKNGCNLTRIWLNNRWTLKVEDGKLGTYNMEHAKKLDEILALAEKYGIYIILTLDSYGSLMPETGTWDENAWDTNPYNSDNGGPCSSPEDFFTHPTAIKYYKNRLNYIMARWGYSPNILAFELWNEMDTPMSWTAEMILYAKSLNPHGQFTTTSLGYPWGNNFDESLVWSMDAVDIIQRHIYGNQSKDITGYLISTSRANLTVYRKPVITEEFGMDMSKSDRTCDLQGYGIAFHNSLWACACSGSFSTALNWWWDEYVIARKLYTQYAPLKKFLEGINWDSKVVKFAKTTSLACKNPKTTSEYSDVVIKPRQDWGDTRYKVFTIDNNGDISGGVVNHYLHGEKRREIRIEPVFHVNYPENGKFIITIGMVSDEANLKVLLDNALVLSKYLPAGKGKGPWQNSFYKEADGIYIAHYFSDVSVDIPKGEHTIRLINSGKDWVGLKTIKLTNYTSGNFADARATGMVIGKHMIFWIQNKNYDWQGFAAGKTDLERITGASFNVLEIPDGNYLVEWWDTLTGSVLKTDNSKASDNTLKLNIPPFSKDIACKITRK
ncbi:MAG: DUF5060 domain-containing protein [Candidatus Omnitrophica bacterium]|nr:DUF5060 domain-containing protein [Candidatus Omnitrophota bacterium]